jgi:hypothetical protein
MEVSNFGPLPVNFGSTELFNSLDSFFMPGLSSQDIQSLSSNENFWRVAFSTELNTPGQPVVQGNNVLVFIPVEQTYPDESYANSIVSYYPFWINNTLEQSLHLYFMNSDKMEDNFWTIYFRYFM